MSAGDGLPAPVVDAFTAPFWEGVEAGRLLCPHCADCDLWFFVPEPVCPRCLSTQWSWAQCAGRGTLASWTVVERAPLPDVQTPYIVAVVDLAEGASMMTHLVDADPGRLRLGDQLMLSISRRAGVALPTFTLAQ